MDPVGAKLLEVAKKELGYREQAGGYTKYGDWYGKHHGGGNPYFKTAPWCDMFLAWAADQIGVTEWAGTFAATIQHARWFQEKGAWGTEPEPGALVFFAWSGSKSTSAIRHVGIVESVSGSTVRTIEANTDGVHLKRKTRNPGVIVGYGYPGKVEVVGRPVPGTTPEENTAKPAAPAANLADAPRPVNMVTSQRTAPQPAAADPLVQPDVLLGGLLAAALAGTVALGIGKSAAAKLPAEAPVRVRRRGKHHRTPVKLPADIAPADLDASESKTMAMPVLSAAAAAEAEDREFWSRVSPLQDDEELAFWDSLLADVPRIPSNTPATHP